MPRMMAAASTKVVASAINRMFIDVGNRVRMAAATPKPTAPVSMLVAATIAFAFPIWPGGTRLGIAACLAGWTIALILDNRNRIGTMSHQAMTITKGVATRMLALTNS